MTIIGFAPVVYSALENDGPIVFRFGILSGQLEFDVGINFNPSDGTALAGKTEESRQKSLLIFNLFCYFKNGCKLVMTFWHKIILHVCVHMKK